MKDVIGFARNEPIELVLGNVLIGAGGFLLGLIYLNSEFFYLVIPALVAFSVGIILDVRVLRKFSVELTKIRAEINSARRELRETREKVFGNRYAYSNSSRRNSLEGKVKDLEKQMRYNRQPPYGRF